MSLKRLLISIFCLCCFSNIFASNSNTKISITEIIPDTVNFGIDGQAVFTTTVKNIAADSTTLRLTKMVLTLPTGITINTKSTTTMSIVFRK